MGIIGLNKCVCLRGSGTWELRSLVVSGPVPSLFWDFGHEDGPYLHPSHPFLPPPPPPPSAPSATRSSI